MPGRLHVGRHFSMLCKNVQTYVFNIIIIIIIIIIICSLVAVLFQFVTEIKLMVIKRSTLRSYNSVAYSI